MQLCSRCRITDLSIVAETPALEAKALQAGAISASFVLRRGECLAVQGPSGSGKSRLLRALADLDPAAGEVWTEGLPRDSMPAPVWRRRVCYVPAEPGWWAETVEEHFIDWTTASVRAPELGLAKECGSSLVRRLSTGERQRLAVLRALSVGPAVLLLDEPTSALDEAATNDLERLLAREQTGGTALLWVTHSTEQARRVASRRLIIDSSELREAN
jgi:phosphate-transporting ATPase